MQQKEFDEHLNLLSVKNNLLIQFVESVWFKILVLHLRWWINFPFKKKFSQEILSNFVENTSQLYVLPNLLKCYICSTMNFDVWMNKRTHQIFALVVIFLGSNW
jgi:hypothetical protein